MTPEQGGELLSIYGMAWYGISKYVITYKPLPDLCVSPYPTKPPNPKLCKSIHTHTSPYLSCRAYIVVIILKQPAPSLIARSPGKLYTARDKTPKWIPHPLLQMLLHCYG